MRNVWIGLAIVLLTTVVGGGTFVYRQITKLTWEQVQGDVYVIKGLGGNVGVLKTREGAVVVDTMTFPIQGERIRALAEELAGGPVHTVINTHYHRDHTHGNPAFGSASQIIATERTREHLLARDADSWEDEAAATLPNKLVNDSLEIEIGGKTLRLLHPGRGHTDGDLVVLFVEDRVVHLGDLFFNRRYPRIDRPGGGSAREWTSTLDHALALDFDRVIPGHGAITDAAGLRAFQSFLSEAVREVEAAVSAGRSRAQAQAEVELESDAGYGPGGLPPIVVLDLPAMVGEIWDEVTAR
ncbi:MAG: MBL fold metallo-hydrolase [Deltaproteobacteria bacterium]|nr:MBL fold metallo-hydrolase [Deltaproteobacteria bacterium]MBW2386935.1 MBL fold metallo-hydrolase [Deltaproteobacteria bacterium]